MRTFLISRRALATSAHPVAEKLRALRRGIHSFSLPIPIAPFRLWIVVAKSLTSVSHFFRRVCIAEPWFKAHCARWGSHLHTDIHLHSVSGSGEIVIGNDVLVDGSCSFVFAARYSDHPTIEIGDHTGIGHGCRFTIGKRITLGKHVRLASYVEVMDSTGHPTDPLARRAGLPLSDSDVQPVTIHDDVWIGRGAVILPGVTIGQGSIVGIGAVVSGNVPPYTIVSGNPARRIAQVPHHPTDSTAEPTSIVNAIDPIV